MIRAEQTARRPLRAVALAGLLAASVGLSGCISLFPKQKPATLYRFGTPAAASPAATAARPAPGPGSFAVLRGPTGFPRAAATDQILTVTNGETAYVKDARWISPAIVLFEEALARAFDADTGPARLVSRGEIARSDFTLKLDVRSFETQYLNGPESIPTVVVAVRGLLTRNNDSVVVGEQMFEARVPATDNRVSAIVPAYDAATAKVLGEIITWTNQRGAANPAPPPPPAPPRR